MSSQRTIFLAGGGTGGHLYPGIAVAEALRAILGDFKPVFLCTEREIDETILTPTGFEFIKQPIVPPRRSVGGLLKFWATWRATKDVVRTAIRQHNPVAVLGLGGYAAGVGLKYAAKKGLPTAILNPDVIPGKANQFLLRYIRVMCCQFEATKQYVAQSRANKIQITGCPIRSDISNLPRKDEAMSRLGLTPGLMTLVITGASLGAMTVNQAVVAALASIKLQGWQILHLSGKEHAQSVRSDYRELGIPASVIDFTPAMADVWAAADLVVSRSGASSCAELTACGLPSILMPYPYHKDKQQTLNAKVLADAGAAILLDDLKDKQQNASRLTPILQTLLYDSTKRTTMAQAAKSLGKPQAAAAVAAVITRMIGDGR